MTNSGTGSARRGSKNTEFPGSPVPDLQEKTSEMSPAGFEPTTYGLKVPITCDQYIIFEQAHESTELIGLIERWPQFSAAKRAAILALIEAQID
jgi:hypothetical protein